MFYIFLGPFLGKYKCAKFHYCSICLTDFRQGVCITASGNILASGKISLKLFMGPLKTTELLTF